MEDIKTLKLKRQIRERQDLLNLSNDESSSKLLLERNWNTGDFLGKYHLSRFQNKEIPLPGTQVKIEKDYELSKEYKAKILQDKIDETERKIEHKLKVKDDSAKLRTRAYMETIIGLPISQSEEILYERERILKESSLTVHDSKTQIDQFIHSISQGRHHYVAYATSQGFKSLDYQNPDNGDTALHIAVRGGFVETVEALLRHKCTPDIKNKLGYAPIHEAWRFWKPRPNRRLEERLAQEEATNSILRILLSYGTHVDSQNLDGESALHIACRLGTPHAVKILLNFKADYLLVTKKGLMANEIAEKFKQDECRKILLAWKFIRHHLVHLDYVTVWHKFLQDYEAVISSHKTAEDILLEISMEGNIARLERETLSGVQIDDPMLRNAYIESYKGTRVPKPWEQGWKTYVKAVNMNEATEVKARLDYLNAKNKSIHDDHHHHHKQHDNKPKTLIQQIAHRKLMKMRAKLKLIPDDRPVPMFEPVHPSSSKGFHSTTEADGEEEEGEEDPDRISNSFSQSPCHDDGTDHHAKPSMMPHRLSSFRNKSFHKSFKRSSSSTQLATESSFTLDDYNEDELFLKSNKYHLPSIDTDEDSRLIRKKFRVNHQLGHESELHHRRMELAKTVLLDAKFLRFTKRLATSSSMTISLRNPYAPLEGTEEEHDEIRQIVSQGLDFEKLKLNKKQDKLAAYLTTPKIPSKSTMGAYSEDVKYMEGNEREKLYDSLAMKLDNPSVILELQKNNNSSVSNDSKNEKLTSSSTKNDNLSPKKKEIEFEMKHKIDLVQDCRPRYVQSDLLPPIRTISYVEEMATKLKNQENNKLLIKEGLFNDKGLDAARKEIEIKISHNLSLSLDSNVSMDGNEAGGVDQSYVQNSKKRTMDERNNTLNKLFLQQKEIKYGKGRVTSTHNSKGKIEEPWTTVTGKYSVLLGDRTA